MEDPGSGPSTSGQEVSTEPRRFLASKRGASSDAIVAVDAKPGVKSNGPVKRFVRQQVPTEILEDPLLKAAMAALPRNYNLEIPKTVWRLKQAKAKTVALQFPEGLLMYATTISDILERFAGVEHCLVLGDVTYGACCVDDFSAAVLGADFLVHYGHSCLVPVDVTSVPCLYVFVDIAIDVEHLVETVKFNFKPGAELVLAGTIQFAAAIQTARGALGEAFPSLVVPQAKPLSPGEVLGCTAPVITSKADAIVFVADGRFHLEAIMIANPTVPAYRYDPYSKVLTLEEYDHLGMRRARRRAIESSRSSKRWGVVLGTLGRQGNPRILTHVETRLKTRGLDYVVFLVSELSPQKVENFGGVINAWVQIACPRLSIDWGEAFAAPLLTPYELEVALGFVAPWWGGEGPADVSVGSAEVSGRGAGVIGDVSGKRHGGESGRTCGCGGSGGTGSEREDGVGSRPTGCLANEDEGVRIGGSSRRNEGSSKQGLSSVESRKVVANGTSESAGKQGGLSSINPEVPVLVSEVSGVCSCSRQQEAVPGSELKESVAPYPMDYYARDGGPWNSAYGPKPRVKPKARLGSLDGSDGDKVT